MTGTTIRDGVASEGLCFAGKEGLIAYRGGGRSNSATRTRAESSARAAEPLRRFRQCVRATDRMVGQSRGSEAKDTGACAFERTSRAQAVLATTDTTRRGAQPRGARRRRLRFRHDRATRGDGARRRPRSARLFPRHGAVGGGSVRPHERGSRGRVRRTTRRRPLRRGPGPVRQLARADAGARAGQPSRPADGRRATRSPPENSTRPASSSSISATRTSRAEASAARARSSSVIGEGPSSATMRSRAASSAVGGDVGRSGRLVELVARRRARHGLRVDAEKRLLAPERLARRRRPRRARRTGRRRASARAPSRRPRPRCRSSRPASGGRWSLRRAGRAASRAPRTPGGSARGRSGR